MHDACPGFSLYPPFAKKSGGTDPTRETQHTAAMYTRILRLLNNTMYLSGLTMQKYLSNSKQDIRSSLDDQEKLIPP